MFTPGYDEENKSKPTIVREIESTDDGLTAEQAALGLFKGSQPKLLLTLKYISFQEYRRAISI